MSILRVNAIQDTGGTNALLIDSAGRVSRPNTPAFHAYNGANQTSAESVIQFTTTSVNVGSHYNTTTYRFTAPVAGNYFFTFSAMAGSTTYNRFGLYKNGSIYGGQKFAANQTYERFSASWIVDLAVNDYVTIVSGIVAGGNGEINVHNNYRDFTGFLL